MSLTRSGTRALDTVTATAGNGTKALVRSGTRALEGAGTIKKKMGWGAVGASAKSLDGSVAQQEAAKPSVKKSRTSRVLNAPKALVGAVARAPVGLAEKTASAAEELGIKNKATMAELAQVAAAARLEKKLNELRWRRPWIVKVRSVLSWLFQYFVMFIFFFYSFLVALKFGETATNKMLMGWVIAYSCTFAIIEPAQVFLLTATPCLFVETNRCGRCLIRCRFIYNELLAP